MYFKTPGHSVAFNAKCGSASLVRAIIETFHPESLGRVMAKGRAVSLWHVYCPQERIPSRPVVLVVRHPADRFVAAMAQLRLTDADEALDALESDGMVCLPRKDIRIRLDPHFRHQHSLLRGGAAFPLHRIDEAAALIGLPVPLPHLHRTSRHKVELTDEQRGRVLTHYADDLALYESLT